MTASRKSKKTQRMTLRRTVRAMALLALIALAGDALAILGGPPPPFTKADIEKLQSNPKSLIAEFYKGGPSMAQFVARALVASPALIDPVLSTMDMATPNQAAAIGAGIARASRAIGKKNPKAVRDFSNKVSKSGNMRLKLTFHAIGPNFVSNRTPIMPQRIPEAPMSHQPIGDELAGTESRIGPKRVEVEHIKRDHGLRKGQTGGDENTEGDTASGGGEILDSSAIFSAIVADGLTQSTVLFSGTSGGTTPPPSSGGTSSGGVSSSSSSSSSGGVGGGSGGSTSPSI